MVMEEEQSQGGSEASPNGGDDANKTKEVVYVTPDDLSMHNCAEDCWVSLFGEVLDLTKLVKEHSGPLADPLIAAAGTDITHWFNANTGDPKMAVSAETGLLLPYTPLGRFIHVPPPFPTSAWQTNFGLPWWKDPTLSIGQMTRKARRVRVVNMLAKTEDDLVVAKEDTIKDIQARYVNYNAHAASYTWKALKDDAFFSVDMGLTLEENGVADDDSEMERLQIEDDYYTPVLHIYFNDDLTIA